MHEELTSHRSAGVICRLVRAARATVFDRLPRLFFLAAVSVVTGALLLAAKIWLFVLSPDWFLLANIVFATGVIVAKVYLLRRRVLLRTVDQDAAKRAEGLAYRHTGVLIIVLSAAYLLTLLPAMLGTHTFLGHDRAAAITLTVVAFTELILAFVAANAGRKDTEPIASAIRRMNIAMAVIMIALAQSALVMAFGDDGSPKGTSAAVAFGLIAAAIGGGMLRSPSQSSHGSTNG